MGEQRIAMPGRQPTDGEVSVSRQDGKIWISVTTDRHEQRIVCGEFNAWRLFGILAFVLGVPLSRKVTRAIKLTSPWVQVPDGKLRHMEVG